MRFFMLERDVGDLLAGEPLRIASRSAAFWVHLPASMSTLSGPV